MSTDFPEFPTGETPPSRDEIATLIASGLPEADRDAAVRLLVDPILVWDLRGMPTDPDATPKPRAVARAAYESLARQLAEVPREQRRARIEDLACSRRGDRLVGSAIALAVARHVADRGRPRSPDVRGYLDDARPYLALDPKQLAAEADRLVAELAAYEPEARSRDVCFARQRIALVHARHALDSARTGNFAIAGGALYSYLRNAGEHPQQLDIH